ncbi:Fatty-acid amide hydrolase 2 [Blattella germanica]|nr:Fatty-acid amide hydrolase 2 [Blattella germanica]
MKSSKKLPPIRNKLLYHSATTLARMIRTRKAAILDARYVDRMIMTGAKSEEELETETPFLGVPFSVKGSIAVKGLKHSAGEQRFEGRRSQDDADSVKLLRAAGAIPLVVTATPELCMSVETFNKIIGTTNNPYDLRRTPSGSSGGEAALISSAGSIIGIGSDIAGSLRIPAAFTGIFSHKATPGMVNVSGHNPTSPDENWDRYFTIGPMARYSEDLKKMVRVLVGKNADRLRLNEKINMKNIKFYYMEDDGGCVVTERVNPEIKGAIQKLPWKIILRDMLKFYMCMSEYSFPPLQYALLKRMSVWISESKMQRIREKMATVKQEFNDLLGEDGVFLYPTFVDTAHFHKELYFKLFSINYTMIMNALEVPVTNCPIGMSKKGLPIGIQVTFFKEIHV